MWNNKHYKREVTRVEELHVNLSQITHTWGARGDPDGIDICIYIY